MITGAGVGLTGAGAGLAGAGDTRAGGGEKCGALTCGATAMAENINALIITILQSIVNQLLFDKLQHANHGGHIKRVVKLMNVFQ